MSTSTPGSDRGEQAAATTGLGLSLRPYLELRLRMEWPDGGAPASSPERIALAVLDAMEDEMRQLRETLTVLWGDFEWLCEQHPEHYGSYYMNRKEQVEWALSPREAG